MTTKKEPQKQIQFRTKVGRTVKNLEKFTIVELRDNFAKAYF